MQKKNGISLIVLVITIIVMIILAGVIMISLNNSGIIKKAEQAVEDTNLQEIRNLAALKWSEAYLKGGGKYTQPKLEKEVLAALKAEEIDLTPYKIIVTEKGVTVEKIPTIADLEAAHIFKYYSTLSGAVLDVNNDTIGENADVDKKDAVAGIYTEEGKITVVLLKDTTESKRITVQKDMTINLGGNKVTFDGDIGFDTVEDNANKIYIDGAIEGSEIYSENANISCALQVRSGNNVKVEGTILSAYSSSGSARTVNMKEDSSAQIINCNIFSTTEAALGNANISALGIVNYGNLTISNTKIVTDAKGTKTETDPVSVGIETVGILYATNCYVYGTHTGLNTQAGSKIYITGGTYESPGFGGMYLDYGSTGELYIEGAQINRCGYNGEFKEDFSNKISDKGGLYVAGDSDNENNMEVNVNNCEITNLEGPAIVLHGTKTTVRISNSKISKDDKIKIDDNENTLVIGKGCNFTADDTNLPSVVVEDTDGVYVK